MYMRDSTDEFADVRVPGSLKLASSGFFGRSALPGNIADKDPGLDDSGCFEVDGPLRPSHGARRGEGRGTDRLSYFYEDDYQRVDREGFDKRQTEQ